MRVLDGAETVGAGVPDGPPCCGSAFIKAPLCKGGESRALPVADEARRTSGSGQNFGGLNAAAKFWAPQQEIRFWPPCVKGAVTAGDWGIVAPSDNPSGASRHLPLHKGGFGNGLPRQCEHWLAMTDFLTACPPGCCSGRTCLPVFDMTTKNRQKRACLIG